LYFFETTSATMSFVLVLPTLPVIAITGILYKFRLYSAICCNAFIVSSTIIIAESVNFFIISSGISTFSNIKHFAPFFNTSSYNSFPFTLSPFIPTNTSPDFISLLSMQKFSHISYSFPHNNLPFVIFFISPTVISAISFTFILSTLVIIFYFKYYML